MYCPNDECPDLIATGLRSEYRDDVKLCPFCGSALVAARPDEPSRGGDDGAPMPGTVGPEDMVEVASTADLTEVAVVKSVLDAAGIPYLVVGDEPFSAFPGIVAAGSMFGPRLRGAVFTVPRERADEARALLERLENGDAPDGWEEN
jgi:hypothetical protein